MAYTALTSLKQKIEQLLNSLNNPEIELIYQEVWSLQSFLEKNVTLQSNMERLKALESQILEAVPKLEAMLESHISQSQTIGNGSNNTTTEKVKQELYWFIEKFTKIKSEYTAGEPEPSNSIEDFRGKEKMVGVNNELRRLEHRLVGGSLGLEIVSVVGMAGIGKTNLVEEVYYDHRISSYFDFQSLVKVGPEYDVNEILLDVLVNMYPKIDDKVEEKSEEQLIEQICVILKSKRYMIVLDDVWNIDVWDKIMRAFPDDYYGSRIIFTTRQKEVALRLSRSSEIYEVPFLSKEESWNLFCKKVFVPPELEKVGKKIVKICEGLPLAIISIGNRLSKYEKTLMKWEEVAENENKVVVGADDDADFSKVLYLSYKHLPQYLKECFLYMGVFPPNYRISISQLVKLWVAEGFLNPNRFQTFEDMAEEYLDKLVSKNLVLARQRSSRGRIKTCSIHYVFRRLCINEAEKDKFFHLIKHEDTSTNDIHSQLRLCIHVNVLLGIKEVYKSMALVTNARSILCTGPHHQYPVPICPGLTSLEVLDALTIRSYKFPMKILELVKLKFLALTYNGKLPSDIFRLENLLYLIVHQYHLAIINSSGAPWYLPMEIWKMQKLRHLQVMGSDLPDPVAGAFLPNLLTLFDVSARSCTQKFLEKIPNLEKLGVRVVLPQDISETSHLFHHLSLLHGLTSFKCVVLNPNPSSQVLRLPESISSSRRLTKLSLSGCGFAWKDMSLIGELPNLQVLKLRCYAFRGPEWEPGEEEFPLLGHLLLEDTDLVHWRVKDSCFPWLERLIIQHCYKLEEIPFVLGDIVTLQKIELFDCSPSAGISAKKMQEEQRKRGNEKLQIQVSSSWDDMKLKP